MQVRPSQWSEEIDADLRFGSGGVKKRVFAELRLDGGIILKSASPYKAEPAIATLWITCQADWGELESGLDVPGPVVDRRGMQRCHSIYDRGSGTS